MSALHRVAIAQIPAQPGRTLVLAGAGTPALTMAVRLSRLLAELGIDQEILGHLVANWNIETRQLRPCRGPTLAPSSVLPGLPHGFGASTELCQRFRPAWLPWLEEAFRRLHHRSARAGLVGGF